jgi:phosphocarrier protein HPr
VIDPDEEGFMPERTVTVASSVGLHARPASLFSQAAANTGVPITLTSPSGRSVNAASILGVLSLGVGYGDEVTLSADGDGADAALDGLVELLSKDLDKE